MMRALQFQKAFEYFRQSDVAVADLVWLVPGLLPEDMAREQHAEPPIVIRAQVKKLMGDTIK